MKRLQIYIEEELDGALGAEARRQHTSKAALIREYVADRLRLTGTADPVDELVGLVDGEPDWSATVNESVYGPR